MYWPTPSPQGRGLTISPPFYRLSTALPAPAWRPNWARPTLRIGTLSGCTCDRVIIFEIQPDGVWTHRLYEFLGSGTDYLLAPGETAVLATDAVDHGQIHPSCRPRCPRRFICATSCASLLFAST